MSEFKDGLMTFTLDEQREQVANKMYLDMGTGIRNILGAQWTDPDLSAREIVEIIAALARRLSEQQRKVLTDLIK